jgi:hypothetical protein
MIRTRAAKDGSRRSAMKTWVVMLAAMLLVAFSEVLAQDTATIVGTVTDSTGAVIPEVKVTVSNPDKGIKPRLGVRRGGRVPGSKAAHRRLCHHG